MNAGLNEQITDCNRAVEQDGSGDALALVYPVLPYKEALDVQHNVVCALKENRIKTDIVLFMEHLPVYTLGKRGGRDYLHVSDVWLKDHGIDVVQTGRGGSITWHGPGQLVVYPIMNLKKAGLGAAEYVHKLETIMIHVAGQLGINASRRESGRGVWVGNKKLGSVGVAISRNISFHGLALNVNNSFGFFKKINPCGLHDIEMTSLEKEGVYGISVRSIRQTVMESIEKFFGIKLKRVSPDSFPDTIGCPSRRLSRQNKVRKPD